MLSPLLFIIVSESLSREIRSVCPEELLYADDLVLVSERVDSLKGILKVWRRGLESRRLRLNVKKTLMMVITHSAGQVTEEGKFSCAVCRKGIDRCWVHEIYSNIRGTLKEDSKCKCQICAN